MKNYSEYHQYTTEKVSELKKMTKDLPRPEGVKFLKAYLGISERNARRQYAKYIENKEEVHDVASLVEHPRKIRRLFWDIEVSPNIGMFWKSGYKLSIGYESIIKERAIICIGYKWEGEDKVYTLRWDKNQDDKELLTKFLEIANTADEMVAHNGDRFDMPWFKTRCLFHGLPTIPDYKQVDTLQWARRKFYFNSNKLDYIAQFLGLGNKLHSGYGLWKDILLNNCPKAMDLMLEYCEKDVILLEQVWAKLSEFVNAKTHAGVLGGGEAWTCPRTGSDNVAVSKTRVTASGTVQYQFRNLDTGTYYTVGSVAYAKYLEAKKS